MKNELRIWAPYHYQLKNTINLWGQAINPGETYSYTVSK